MGWYFGYDSRKDLMKNILGGLTYNKDGNSMSVVAHCCKGNNLWAVCEKTKTENGESKTYRFIFLALMRVHRENGRSEWGYKDMDETCGPNESGCPLTYLQMAPVVDVGYAKEWRERVKAYWVKKIEGKEFAKTLKYGDKFNWCGKEIKFIELYKNNYVIGESAGRIYKYKKSEISPVQAVTAAV